MPEFVPVLAAALVILIALFLVFGGLILPEAKETKRFLLGEDFEVSYIGESERIGSVNGTISKGILTGEEKSLRFDVIKLSDVANWQVKLNISETNLHGPFLIYMNGQKVSSTFPAAGERILTFDKNKLRNENTLEFKAGSSGWRFWAPTIYTFSSKVYLNYFGLTKQEFTFDLSSDELYPVKSSLLITGTRRRGTDLVVLLNDVEIYRGMTNVFEEFPSNLLKGDNKVEILTEEDTKYDIETAEIVLNYK